MVSYISPVLGTEWVVINLRDNAAEGNEDTENRLVTDGTARSHPSQGNDRAGLDMTDDSAGNRASLSDDEELRDVDQGSEKTRLEFFMSAVCAK